MTKQGLDPAWPEPTDVPEVPAEVLRGALELAVKVLRAEQRQPGAPALPSTMRQVLAARRLTAPHLIAVRKVVAGDPALRERVAATADVDVVGVAGLAWLRRGPGWVEVVRAAADAQQASEREAARIAELEATARTEERRRRGAEERAERAEARLASLEAELARERSRRVDAEATRTKHDQVVASLRAEIEGLLDRVRRAEAAAAEAQERLAAAERAREQAEAEVAEVAEVRDRALADRVANQASSVRSSSAIPMDVVGGLREAAGLVRHLADVLERVACSLASPGGPAPATTPPSSAGRHHGPSRRRPLKLPGGVLADSAAAAAHLLRAPEVELVVDGYNVAKLGWPHLALSDQREQCIAATEDVARRFGTQVIVVFDGSDVPGASSTARRLVRVVYSPAGVIADDVIREEVAAIPVHRPVVVATNDAELARSVRALGANLISSEQLLEVASRTRR